MGTGGFLGDENDVALGCCIALPFAIQGTAFLSRMAPLGERRPRAAVHDCDRRKLIARRVRRRSWRSRFTAFS